MKTPMQPSSPDKLEDLAEKQRIRVTYEKNDLIKFISHQDEFRAWERACRRADLPILYKRGFNPQPHMQFASPLGVGFSGSHELVDITLSPPMELSEVKSLMNAHLPPGLTVHSLREVPLKSPALQTLLIGADYTVLLFTDEKEDLPEELIQTQIDSFLQSSEQWRTRERKGRSYQYNLRPLVLELQYLGYSDIKQEHKLFLRVQQREGATGRPDEVVGALGMDGYARRLQRERLYFADQADDAKLFSQYRVVSKNEIAGNKSTHRRRQNKRRRQSSSARSINQRLAEEIG